MWSAVVVVTGRRGVGLHFSQVRCGRGVGGVPSVQILLLGRAEAQPSSAYPSGLRRSVLRCNRERVAADHHRGF